MNQKYDIISCASFGSSGSSVVTDYLSEYDGIKDLGSYEFRFLQDYMGISTLEDALVRTPHRLNSDIAIQNYMRYVDRQCGNFIRSRYNSFFNNRWKEISMRYIEELVDISWPGYWEEYQITSPKLISAFRYQVLPRIRRALSLKKKYIAHYLPTRPMYFSFPSEEKFLECTRRYVRNLCAELDPDHSCRYIMFDQLMPPADIGRYERYLDSVKTIVVDRDPRDYFLENVVRWGEKWVPADIDDFIRLYRLQREQAAMFEDSENVRRIRFEDTIFHYDSFEKQMQDFLSLDPADHRRPLERFDPSRSVRNTRLWLKRNADIDLIHKIEDSLSDFIYDFDSNSESLKF